MVALGHVERDFGGKFLLEHRETVKSSLIVSSDVEDEVEVRREGVELDLDVGHFHDLVNLPVLLPGDEVSMLVGELDLEADLVVEVLKRRGKGRRDQLLEREARETSRDEP